MSTTCIMNGPKNSIDGIKIDRAATNVQGKNWFGALSFIKQHTGSESNALTSGGVNSAVVDTAMDTLGSTVSASKPALAGLLGLSLLCLVAVSTPNQLPNNHGTAAGVEEASAKPKAAIMPIDANREQEHNNIEPTAYAPHHSINGQWGRGELSVRSEANYGTSPDNYGRIKLSSFLLRPASIALLLKLCANSSCTVIATVATRYANDDEGKSIDYTESIGSLLFMLCNLKELSDNYHQQNSADIRYPALRGIFSVVGNICYLIVHRLLYVMNNDVAIQGITMIAQLLFGLAAAIDLFTIVKKADLSVVTSVLNVLAMMTFMITDIFFIIIAPAKTIKNTDIAFTAATAFNVLGTLVAMIVSLYKAYITYKTNIDNRWPVLSNPLLLSASRV